MTKAASQPDVIIIGSGMGGATAAYSLAPTGASILILEKGRELPERPENRGARAIFQRGFFRPNARWYDATGASFNPGNYYVHGGNSKFHGAASGAIARRILMELLMPTETRRLGHFALASWQAGMIGPRAYSECGGGLAKIQPNRRMADRTTLSRSGQSVRSRSAPTSKAHWSLSLFPTAWHRYLAVA
jgi:choline dehydrogenase-like flavoprotein